MCCSTGVCGTDVDPKLVQFAGDVAWLKQEGVPVERFNLAREPAAFVANPKVAEALKTQGNGCLPLLVVDGEIVTRSIYPTRDQLRVLAGVEGESSACCEGGEGGSGCCGEESSCCCQ